VLGAGGKSYIFTRLGLMILSLPANSSFDSSSSARVDFCWDYMGRARFGELRVDSGLKRLVFSFITVDMTFISGGNVFNQATILLKNPEVWVIHF